MFNKTILVNFAGTDIHKEYQRTQNKMYGSVFHAVESYTLEGIKDTPFYEENMDIFSYQKYSGYFLWKPYIIKKTLDKYPGYNVLYLDSNTYFKDLDSFKKLFDSYMKEDGLFFIKHWNRRNIEWTKRDCLRLMLADTPRYHNANQVWSVVQGWSRDSETAIMMLEDYLVYCRSPQCLTEIPNEFGDNYPEFKEHRWEQSILSILVEGYSVGCADDRQTINYVDKNYNKKLLEQKERENEDPLKRK